jgi:hypothetical protein
MYLQRCTCSALPALQQREISRVFATLVAGHGLVEG